jgi:hypothetical protein
MLESISPVLLASVLVGGFVVTSTLPATAEGPDDRRDRLHAERPIAASFPAHHDLHAEAERLAFDEAEARRQAEAEFVAALEAEALAGSQRSWASSRVSAPNYGSCNGDLACFLECTRAHESDTSGGYGAVGGGGTYRGAYQFAQPTWDAAVEGAGFGEYAGVPADQAPAEVQDAAAAHLYSVSGNRPWGGRC